VVDEVFPVTEPDLLRAKDIVLGSTAISARDALHLSIMGRHRIDTILSFNRGFDGFPGVARLS
jgi:predicted nucleic acid-binding protein